MVVLRRRRAATIRASLALIVTAKVVQSLLKETAKTQIAKSGCRMTRMRGCIKLLQAKEVPHV